MSGRQSPVGGYIRFDGVLTHAQAERLKRRWQRSSRWWRLWYRFQALAKDIR